AWAPASSACTSSATRRGRGLAPRSPPRLGGLVVARLRGAWRPTPALPQLTPTLPQFTRLARHRPAGLMLPGCGSRPALIGRQGTGRRRGRLSPRAVPRQFPRRAGSGGDDVSRRDEEAGRGGRGALPPFLPPCPRSGALSCTRRGSAAAREPNVPGL